jgi:hypothetical protein
MPLRYRPASEWPDSPCCSDTPSSCCRYPHKAIVGFRSAIFDNGGSMAPSDATNPLQVFELLARAQVPHVIIGGHAVNFHGYVRTTEDADIIFQRTAASEAALLEALQSIHACWISDDIDPQTRLERLVPVTAPYIRSEHLMMLCTDLGFLDIYDFIPGFPDTPVQEVLAGSAVLGAMHFVSLPWLRKLKAHAGRHKDLDDLEHLPVS